MDDPHGRSKDLEDLGRLMEQYELEGERRFGEEVFEAGADFESTGAFLLRLDVGRLCTGGEAKIVGNLIAALQDDSQLAQRLLRRGRVEESVIEERQRRIEAFAAGFVIGQCQSHDL
jgi:predicted nucleotidyltransferase